MSRKATLTTDPDVMEEEKKDAEGNTSPPEDANQKETSPAEENAGEDFAKDKLLQENEELRKEIEKLRSKATGSAEATSRKPKKKTKVQIRIPFDYKHKDDLTVGLNGTIYRFQRGKTVEVDEDVAEIIARSMEQDLKTDEMIRALVEEAEKSSKQ